jgi:CubicO group peptidase (beta-lactamase class C family)
MWTLAEILEPLTLTWVTRAVAIAGVVMLTMWTGDAAHSQTVQRIVAQDIQPRLPPDGIGGMAVAVHADGRTSFFNYGWADVAHQRPVTSDSLFNLGSIRKVFEATLLAQAFARGDLGFDDPVGKYVPELQQGGDIRRVTVGQLATHTSGLRRRVQRCTRRANLPSLDREGWMRRREFVAGLGGRAFDELEFSLWPWRR